MTDKEGSEVSDEDFGPKRKYPNFHVSMIGVFFFTISYCIGGLWLLFDGWLNGFSSIYWIWGVNESVGIPPIYKLAMMSLVGSILGCGTLDIVSFNKYVAIEKTYDLDHIWGFFISPVLASIIGLIVFALFQSGLLVFSGSFSNEKAPVTAELGFTAVGFISGYSWHDVINKFRDISQGLFRKQNSRGKKKNQGPKEKLIEDRTDVNITDKVRS